MNNEAKFVCSCGLSTKFPMCDGKHFVARGRDSTKLQPCGAVLAPAVAASAEPVQRQRVKGRNLVGA